MRNTALMSRNSILKKYKDYYVNISDKYIKVIMYPKTSEMDNSRKSLYIYHVHKQKLRNRPLHLLLCASANIWEEMRLPSFVHSLDKHQNIAQSLQNLRQYIHHITFSWSSKRYNACFVLDL